MRDLNEFASVQVLYLTTTGRVSGRLRTVEIWFVMHQGDLYCLAEHRHQTGWVKNIEKNPLVHISIEGNDINARGRILDPGVDADSWKAVQDLATEKYGWGDGLPVRFTPEPL